MKESFLVWLTAYWVIIINKSHIMGNVWKHIQYNVKFGYLCVWQKRLTMIWYWSNGAWTCRRFRTTQVVFSFLLNQPPNFAPTDSPPLHFIKLSIRHGNKRCPPSKTSLLILYFGSSRDYECLRFCKIGFTSKSSWSQFPGKLEFDL